MKPLCTGKASGTRLMTVQVSPDKSFKICYNGAMSKIIERHHTNEEGWVSSARYTPCEIYRYTLQRVWEPHSDIVSFIGLNPSTATEMQNDPTVRRCIGFAQKWGYGGMRMLNAYALRSTDPKGLKKIDDPVGKDNDHWILKMTEDVPLTVLCWGTHAALHDRHEHLLRVLTDASRPLHCLGKTLAGFPKHPLYLRQDLLPVPFVDSE